MTSPGLTKSSSMKLPSKVHRNQAQIQWKHYWTSKIINWIRWPSEVCTNYLVPSTWFLAQGTRYQLVPGIRQQVIYDNIW